MKRLVLDLRGNGGGFLNAAIDLSDEFLPSGRAIVYTEGRNSPRQDADATKRWWFRGDPAGLAHRRRARPVPARSSPARSRTTTVDYS
jgi:hypothetical protein